MTWIFSAACLHNLGVFMGDLCGFYFGGRFFYWVVQPFIISLALFEFFYKGINYRYCCYCKKNTKSYYKNYLLFQRKSLKISR